MTIEYAKKRISELEAEVERLNAMISELFAEKGAERILTFTDYAMGPLDKESHSDFLARTIGKELLPYAKKIVYDSDRSACKAKLVISLPLPKAAPSEWVDNRIDKGVELWRKKQPKI